MGDRGQVLVKDRGHRIFLYTHWGAHRLVQDVQRALAKKWRWNDAEYLTRIIFDKMKGDDIDCPTGYGIGNRQHGDIWRLVVVDCRRQTVVVRRETVINGKWVWNTEWKGSFDDFIKEDLNKLEGGE